MKVTKQTHVFIEDPAIRDDRIDQPWCVCGLPADNAIHKLPARTDQERDAEARRMGERFDTT